MKVLLLAPQFWISGTVTFARELQAGWPSELARPPIAVPTRSGKPSALWGRGEAELLRATHTAWTPDVFGSAQEIIDITRSFDIVHVTEVDMPLTQREWWVQLLEKLPVPWTIQLHGNLYEDVDWARVCSASNFTGIIYRTPGNTPGALADLVLPLGLRFVDLPRPWNLRNPIDASVSTAVGVPQIIGTHSRIAPDKGVALIAALSRHIKRPVCMHGASLAGSYPYALTVRHRYCSTCNDEPAHTPWMSDDGLLRYFGPFSDGVHTAAHHAVHVSATRRGFSGGTEYAVLEAIDAGCRIVQPKHMVHGPQPDQWLYEWEQRGVVGAISEPLESLNEAVLSALGAVDYDPTTNRQFVAREHNPARVVREFLSEVAVRV